MRCRNCGYRLWGVKRRNCPECGTPFLPSQFEFVPNSVCFRCPHCDQDYYGTTAQGHLDPPAFNCVRCGRPVSMDEMTLFPTSGLEEEQTQAEKMPWLVREKIGFARAWWQTLCMSMVSPVRLIQLTPPGSSLATGWWFAAMTAGLATLVGMLPLSVLPMLMPAPRAIGMVLGLGGMLGLLVWPSVVIAAWGGLTHALLALTGRHDYGAGRTYQAMCYSSGPNLLVAVPCMGVYLAPVAWIWWSVNAILMVRHAQRVGTMRATIAVASLPLILTAGLTLLIVFVFVPSLTAAQQTAATIARQTRLHTLEMANRDIMTAALSNYAQLHGGRWPPHASELIAVGMVRATVFVQSDWSTAAPKVPVADSDLAEFSSRQPDSQAKLAKAAARSLPPGVLAHRLGDFVFTYHGIDLDNASPGLWTFVLWPENQQPGTRRFVHFGLADGTADKCAIETFTQYWLEQNKLRAAEGLPHLPDPRTVTHDHPAVPEQ